MQADIFLRPKGLILGSCIEKLVTYISVIKLNFFYSLYHSYRYVEMNCDFNIPNIKIKKQNIIIITLHLF